MNTLPYVISSRVRLARNVQGYRFPRTASYEERKAVLERVQDVIRTNKSFRHARMVSIDHLNPLESRLLEENRLISHLLATQGSSRLAILSGTADSSILVNEEDHLRIQAFSPGLGIQTAWQTAKKLERSLGEHLDFAYSEHYGYLTTCPENAGRGIRASVMLFVPGLILLKRSSSLIRQCVSVGYTVRGTYGEGSQSQGYALQISNQGASKQQARVILKGVDSICRQIIRQERLARLALLSGASQKLRQRILWARNQLVTQQELSLKTAFAILGMYRLRCALDGQARTHHLQGLDHLAIQIQPAHVCQHGIRQCQGYTETGDIEDENEDMIRATFLQQRICELLNC